MLASEDEGNTNEGILRSLEHAEEALQEIRQQLAAELHEAAAEESQRLREKQVQELKEKLKSLAANRTELKVKLDVELERAKMTGRNTSELEFMRTALSREQLVHERISNRKMSLLTEMDAPPRMSLMESASLPTEPVEGRPIKRILFIGLAGLLLPFGLVVAGGLIRPPS